MLAGVLAMALAVAVGSVPLGAADLWAVFTGGGNELQRDLIWSLRAPRALAAFATGEPVFGIIGVVLAVLLIGGGMALVVKNHRKAHDRQKDWHRDHPEVPYEPPTS